MYISNTSAPRSAGNVLAWLSVGAALTIAASEAFFAMASALTLSRKPYFSLRSALAYSLSRVNGAHGASILHWTPPLQFCARSISRLRPGDIRDCSSTRRDRTRQLSLLS